MIYIMNLVVFDILRCIMNKPDYPIISFKDSTLWSEWLEKNHVAIQGVWVKFYKKHSKVQSISYAEAVEVGLCFGWIDSQMKPFDENSYLQKFTPRRSKSIWSKINTQRIERLIKEGKMRPSGMAQVEMAKADGRWEKAYNSLSTMEIPEDFLKALEMDKKAKSYFEKLNKSNVYAIVWRLQTAKKPETRDRRMKAILEMLSKGEKFY
jgi:uncharacterized protein YdeI (YjbR/CyaY-like superfamily)